MTTSPAAVSAPAAPAGASLRAVPRAVWVAIGVLSLATAGLAGALVTRMASTPAAPAVATAPAPVTAPADGPLPATAQALVPAATPAPVVAPQPAPAHVAAPAPAKAPARAPARNTAHASAAPAPSLQEPAPVAQPMQVARAAVCATCGTVESVHAIEQQGEGSGLGAIAGGVLGGLAGHQVGGGTGKKVMTVLGAVGGGFAGNEVEKRVRTVKAYDVTVRMEDGSVRTLRQSEAVAPGTPVVVEGGVLRVMPARQGEYNSPAPRTLRTSAPA